MMHNQHALYNVLNALMHELNSQIASVEKDGERTIAARPYPENVTVYDLRDKDGRPVLADLLSAKAQVLSGMASLKAADMQSKGRVR